MSDRGQGGGLEGRAGASRAGWGAGYDAFLYQQLNNIYRMIPLMICISCLMLKFLYMIKAVDEDIG